MTPIQKILFGSPGTGKSYYIRNLAHQLLHIPFDDSTNTLQNTVKTVFHPEYTYADFMGKLLPQTLGTSVVYKFYPGHFLRALGSAYRSLIDGNDENYLLVIDELNRGNAAAIFGAIFQLLDREDDHWSSYDVDISELELVGLFNAMNYRANVSTEASIQVDGSNFQNFCNSLEEKLVQKNNLNGLRVLHNLQHRKITIPHNLSIIATINTCDESIYYLDSAFKRRWDWEYIDTPNITTYTPGSIPEIIATTKLILNDHQALQWDVCILGLNKFIKSHHQTIRRIEDKQIGWWFIKPVKNQIQLQQVRDKLMFYLWDSVFARDKKPLEKLVWDALKKEIKIITYNDFATHTSEIMLYVYQLADEELTLHRF